MYKRVCYSLYSDLLDHFVRECVKRSEGVMKEGGGEDGDLEEEGEGEGEGEMETLKTSVATLAQSLDTKLASQSWQRERGREGE